MPYSSLLLVLCCVALSCTELPPWDWKCDPVTDQDGVDIDQVLGRWYFLSKYYSWTDDAPRCEGVEFLRVPDTNILDHTEFHTTPTGEIQYASKSFMFTAVTPSHWVSDANSSDTSYRVIDLPEDGSTLAISLCGVTIVMTVLTRRAGVDVEPVKARLLAAGIPVLEEYYLRNLTGCPPLEPVRPQMRN